MSRESTGVVRTTSLRLHQESGLSLKMAALPPTPPPTVGCTAAPEPQPPERTHPVVAQTGVRPAGRAGGGKNHRPWPPSGARTGSPSRHSARAQADAQATPQGQTAPPTTCASWRAHRHLRSSAHASGGALRVSGAGSCRSGQYSATGFTIACQARWRAHVHKVAKRTDDLLPRRPTVVRLAR